MAKMIDLTTERAQQAALAEPRQPYRLRITPISKFGRRQYHLDNWLPVPAWTRRFDGWTVGAVVRLMLVALAAGVAAAIWLLRLLGRAR